MKNYLLLFTLLLTTTLAFSQEDDAAKPTTVVFNRDKNPVVEISPATFYGNVIFKADFDQSENLELVVTDVKGQVVHSEKFQDKKKITFKIGLYSLAVGKYSFSVYDSNKKLVYSATLVREK